MSNIILLFNIARNIGESKFFLFMKNHKINKIYKSMLIIKYYYIPLLVRREQSEITTN